MNNDYIACPDWWEVDEEMGSHTPSKRRKTARPEDEVIDGVRLETTQPKQAGSGNPNAKLTEEKVSVIKRLWALQIPDWNERRLAHEFQVSLKTIRRICTGQQWCHVAPDVIRPTRERPLKVNRPIHQAKLQPGEHPLFGWG